MPMSMTTTMWRSSVKFQFTIDMASYTKPRRSSSSILTDEELKFFYEEILLFCESDRMSYGSFSRVISQIRHVPTLSNVYFINEGYLSAMASPISDVFYFSAESQANGGSRNSNILKKWFAHIRNAFAHNFITKEGESIVLRDFEPGTYRPTLYVKTSSFAVLRDTVLFVKQIIHQNNNQS